MAEGPRPEVLKTYSITEALDAAFQLIPARGAYSSYTVPFQTLWEKYRIVFTPETLVIFIGDARSSRSLLFEEYLRNICRRVRKTFWLNTEPGTNWDIMDSAASSCAAYADMWEITTPEKWMHFLNSGLGSSHQAEEESIYENR